MRQLWAVCVQLKREGTWDRASTIAERKNGGTRVHMLNSAHLHYRYKKRGGRDKVETRLATAKHASRTSKQAWNLKGTLSRQLREHVFDKLTVFFQGREWIVRPSGPNIPQQP